MEYAVTSSLLSAQANEHHAHSVSSVIIVLLTLNGSGEGSYTQCKKCSPRLACEHASLSVKLGTV